MKRIVGGKSLSNSVLGELQKEAIFRLVYQLAMMT
jgi:hypothetical protein